MRLVPKQWATCGGASIASVCSITIKQASLSPSLIRLRLEMSRGEAPDVRGASSGYVQPFTGSMSHLNAVNWRPQISPQTRSISLPVGRGGGELVKWKKS